MTMRRWLVVCVLAACGGKPAVAPANQGGAGAGVDLDALLAKCNMQWSGDEPTVGDLDSCLVYLRTVYGHDDAAHRQAADDLASNVCTAKPGEACRWEAYSMVKQMQAPDHVPDDTGDEPYGVRDVLQQGCDAGDQESCAILKTGKDASGFEYPIPLDSDEGD